MSAWEIHEWPPVAFHVFLSHAAEDRDRLVKPVEDGLRQQKFIPWFDQRDYPLGREPVHALQDNLLRSRHVVYFVTTRFLKQGRGWAAAERTLSLIAQRQLMFGPRILHNFELPLFFVSRSDETLRRSLWAPLFMNGVVCPHRAGSEHAVRWAVATIQQYIEQQEAYRGETRALYRMNEDVQRFVNSYAGLDRWLLRDRPLRFPS